MNTSNTDQRLGSIVARIVRVSEERKGLGDDIREIYAEAKSVGYDVKALRLVVKHDMEDADARKKREDVEAIADTMEAALGVLVGTPLADAAMGTRRE